MHCYRKKIKRGFSIMEVIVTAFILSVGMVAVIQLMGDSLKLSFENRARVIGSGLAQEGVELVRNIRDQNIKNDANDNAFRNNVDINRDDCRIDTDTPIQSCGSNFANKKMRYNNGLYDHSGGDDTRFYRKIRLTNSVSVAEVEVMSMVIWDGSNFPDVDDCNAANSCAFAMSVLTRWQED